MELTGDQLSAIFGWISMGCWIVVYSPQIIENYRLKSGEGLSLLFLMGWIIGDLCSVSGGIIGGLVPSVIWLGVYHLLSDLIILAQVYYYRWQCSRYPIGPLDCLATPNTSTTALASETGYEVPDYEYDYNHTNYDSDIENTPLLSSGRKSLPDDDDVYNDYDQETLSSVAIKCFCSLVGISIIGIAAWWINEVYFDGDGVGGESMAASLESGSWGNLEPLREPVVQVLGWTTATLFISSNLPQIYKNFKTKCDGLSPGLFVFSAFGSFTYVLSIIAKSFDKHYIIRNAGWLVGHGVSCFLDFVVIGQVIYYRYTERGRRGTYTMIS